MKENSIDYDKGNDLLKQIKLKGITHNAKRKHHKVTLDFQDFVGRNTPEQTNIFYESLDQENRRMFIFATTACLHFETAIDIIKSTTIAIERRKLYKEFDDYATKRELEIYKQREIFKDCKKPIFKKFRKLHDIIELRNGTIDRLKDRIEKLTAEANRHYKEAMKNKESKYILDELKRCFQTITNQLAG